MKEDVLSSSKEYNCKHKGYLRNLGRTFDILNGFEIVASRCCNCNKTLELKIRSLN